MTNKTVEENLETEVKEVKRGRKKGSTKAKKDNPLDFKSVASIEELKERIIALDKAKVDIHQKDIVEALDRFDTNDDDIEEFYDWLNNSDIALIEEEDMADIDDDIIDDDAEDDDDDDDEKLELLKELNPDNNLAAKINDPVKMYLKEIGRVPLLKASEEIEIAKRIEAGDG